MLPSDLALSNLVVRDHLAVRGRLVAREFLANTIIADRILSPSGTSLNSGETGASGVPGASGVAGATGPAGSGGVGSTTNSVVVGESAQATLDNSIIIGQNANNPPGTNVFVLGNDTFRGAVVTAGAPSGATAHTLTLRIGTIEYQCPLFTP